MLGKLPIESQSGANPIVHTSHEFVYCLTRRIVYPIQDHTFLREPGNSLLFKSRLPHRWRMLIRIPG